MPKQPLSYSSTRSIFSEKQRYYQTLETLKSINIWDPSAQVIVLELSSYVWPDTGLNVIHLAQESSVVRKSVESPFKGLGQAVAFCQFSARYPLASTELWWISGRYSILPSLYPSQEDSKIGVIANYSGSSKGRKILATTFIGFRGKIVQERLARFLWSYRWRLLCGSSLESIMTDFAETLIVIPRQHRVVGQIAVSGEWVNQ